MKFIPNKVSRTVARTILKGQKNSPTILFGVGLVAFVGTIVLSNKATLKLDKVLDEHDEAKTITENYDWTDESAKQKEIIYIYARTTRKIAALYGPSIVCGSLAVAALTGSHHILSKRNVALTAAYAALEKGFNEYRDRVREDLGVDKERNLFYDTEGTPKHKTIVGAGRSQYARFFSNDTSTSWSPTPEYNMLFLRCQQNYANDRLRARGHVFLNDVYDMLGISRTPAGAVTGWLWDSDGDNYIDFGIFNSIAQDTFFDFVTGREGGVWLDFNVDGVIFEKI